MKAKKRYGWIIFALFLFLIPSVNIVDLFPDFIGYLIIAKALSYGAELTCTFQEFRAYLRERVFRKPHY